MATQYVKSGRSMVAAAVLTMAMGGMTLMAQDPSAPPPPAPEKHKHHALADGGPNGPGGQERRLEMMTKHLNLTPDQVAQVKTIQTDSMTQAEGLRSDTSLSEADRHSKMRSIHEAAQTKIRAVLNDEQKTKFDAMQAHHRDRQQHEEGQAPPPPPPA